MPAHQNDAHTITCDCYLNL